MIAELVLLSLPPADRKQVDCVAKAIYHEARGEPELGQIAVAQVVLNRTKSNRYPSQACPVVYAPKQFSHINHTKFDFSSEAWLKALDIAALSYRGMIDDPTYGAQCFYNPEIVRKKPRGFGKLLKKIGRHNFHSC